MTSTKSFTRPHHSWFVDQDSCWVNTEFYCSTIPEWRKSSTVPACLFHRTESRMTIDIDYTAVHSQSFHSLNFNQPNDPKGHTSEDSKWQWCLGLQSSINKISEGPRCNCVFFLKLVPVPNSPALSSLLLRLAQWWSLEVGDTKWGC